MPDITLETQGFFPGRGRGWRAWEDEFLKTFAPELGLRVSAEQLRRPPAEVALRISWLGVRLPDGKASLAKPAQPPKLAKKPCAWPRAKAEAPDGWMTCAKVAELAGCRTSVVYSAIWKKKLDALQGDRGVWLVPEDAGREFAEQRKAQMPKNAPVRPVEAKEGVEVDNLPSETGNATETPSSVQKGHVPEKAQETGLNLDSMSKLDILRAIASGKLEAGNAG